MMMSPYRVRASTVTLLPDVPGFSCDGTELRTDPRSLVASTWAAVPSLMPISMFPEPFISFAWPRISRPIRMAPSAVVAVTLPRLQPLVQREPVTERAA